MNYRYTYVFIAIPNITLKVFVFCCCFFKYTSRYDAKSWKQWVLREVVTGRVEQEDARTEKDAE